MLKTRIVTAVVLLLVFSVTLFQLPTLGWVVFSTLIAAVAAWEWGGLMALGPASRIALATAFVFVCSLIGFLDPAALDLESGFSSAAWRLGLCFYVPAALFWFAVVPLWLKCRWRLPQTLMGWMVGSVLLFPAWLALIQLKHFGGVQLLAIMATVWVADIAAYFFGRTLGRHKLAPTISPGKTWEGALGGTLAVVIYGLVLAPVLPEALANNRLLLVLALVFLSSLSVMGDLFESMLKRQVGLKDSSNVLPGHGGVLDRIDSLTSTLPVVALVWLTALN